MDSIPPQYSPSPSSLSLVDTININQQEPGLSSGNIIGVMMVECYLSSPYTNPAVLCWNGPDLLSPCTDASDIFSHISAMAPVPINWIELRLSIRHKYTERLITESPFYLPRIPCTLGNLDRCRERMLHQLRWHLQSKCSPDFRFQIWVSPLADWPSVCLSRSLPASWMDPAQVRRMPGPVEFVSNLSPGF